MRGQRAFDLALAVPGLVLSAPVLAVVALAILVLDGRPVLFRQVRVGHLGAPFVVLKFRTMRAGREVAEYAPGDTRRVTALGRWLRVTKLDELPQLVNVARGEMSIVGPRPEVPEWVAQHPARFRDVLTVRPGLTDPASIAFRHEERLLAAADDPTAAYRDEILPRKLDLYDHYVQERSLTGDLVIIWQTLRALFDRGG